jgi:predicted histidine transporter YuiF (NhaC family)
VIDPQILLSLAKLVQGAVTYHEFARRLDKVIDRLSGLEFSNAQLALRDAQLSSQPRHELTSAITHLRSAAANFKSSTQEARDRVNKATAVIFAGVMSSVMFLVPLSFIPVEIPAAVVLARSRAKLIEMTRREYQCYAMIAAIYCVINERDLTVQYGEIFYDTFKVFVSMYKGDDIGQEVENANKFLSFLNVNKVIEKSTRELS